MTVTRFAPSPNGPLHLGHAFSALAAHDAARGKDGRFLVRIEDIDGARSRSEFADMALADLAWLGLSADAIVRQSDRLDDHRAALEMLRSRNLLYPCVCTRSEIVHSATRIGPDGPVYSGTCRGTDVDMSRPVAWRLDMAAAMAEAGPLDWHDISRGRIAARPEAFGDVVLDRKDAPGSYHLAVVLDDARDEISLVTRGLDLFHATDVHRLLQSLLGLPVPVYAHHALVVEDDGRKLAKRRGSPALADLREAGGDGPALADALRAGDLPDGLSLSYNLPEKP